MGMFGLHLEAMSNVSIGGKFEILNSLCLHEIANVIKYMMRIAKWSNIGYYVGGWNVSLQDWIKLGSPNVFESFCWDLHDICCHSDCEGF